MAAKLGLEARMAIKELARRKVSNCEIARKLGVDEKAVRYHLKRMAEGAEDGRSKEAHRALGWAMPIGQWLENLGEGAGLNLAALHDHLVEEHDYAGSLRSVQRYLRAHYPVPKQRARRRVETPPGAQGQADWAEFPQVIVRGEPTPLHAFHLELSHSRFEAVVWAEREDQMSGWTSTAARCGDWVVYQR